MVRRHHYSPIISLTLKHIFTQVANRIVNVGSSAVYNANFPLCSYLSLFIVQLSGSHKTSITSCHISPNVKWRLGEQGSNIGCCGGLGVGNIIYAISLTQKYMVIGILLCGLRSLVSEWHLLFPKAQTPTTPRFIYNMRVKIRNSEIVVVWHCEQMVEESTVNQWCTLKTDCDR